MKNTARRGQWSLVGILVSLTIIMILSAWYYSKILKPQAGSHNGRPAAEQKAYGSVCSEYQSQITQAVTMYKSDHNDHNPQSFEELKQYGATNDIVKAEGCQFQLDASTGSVTDIGRGQAAPGAQPVVINTAQTAPAATTPGPYWQGSTPAVQPGAAPPPTSSVGPGGIKLPPSSGAVPADGGGGE